LRLEEGSFAGKGNLSMVIKELTGVDDIFFEQD
jgi:hypothetical protein